jgi:hypothetical protein
MLLCVLSCYFRFIKNVSVCMDAIMISVDVTFRLPSQLVTIQIPGMFHTWHIYRVALQREIQCCGNVNLWPLKLLSTVTCTVGTGSWLNTQKNVVYQTTKYKFNAYICFSISLSFICDVKMEWWILVAGEQPRGVRPWESLAYVGVRPSVRSANEN